jgi:hypothetical protein
MKCNYSLVQDEWRMIPRHVLRPAEHARKDEVQQTSQYFETHEEILTQSSGTVCFRRNSTKCCNVMSGKRPSLGS